MTNHSLDDTIKYIWWYGWQIVFLIIYSVIYAVFTAFGKEQIIYTANIAQLITSICLGMLLSFPFGRSLYGSLTAGIVNKSESRSSSVQY